MNKISNATIRRLSIYLRQLEEIIDEKIETVSSAEIAKMSAIKDTQVRKDLSFFGSFGVRGRGYSAKELAEKLKIILGLNKEWKAVLIGVGSLGKALSGYKGFAKHNINFIAVLDSDPAKIGAHIGDKVIERYSAAALKECCEKSGAQIAVIAVPASEAKKVCEEVIQAGFKGIVNYAPVRLHLPEEIALYSVDLAISFEHITFKLNRNSDE